MRSSRTILSIVLAGFLLGPTSLAHAEEAAVSLDALMDAAQRQHPTLAKKPLLAESLELQRARINRAYWPRLSLGGQATWQSEVTAIDIPIPGVAISPPSKDQYRVTLDLQQTIWDGGVASDQKHLAESRARVEREQVELEWYQVRDRILSLYFAGVVQQELEAQAETLHKYVGTLVEKTQLLVDQGLATERDVLLLKARQLEANQASVDANAKLDGIRRSLEDLTGSVLPRGARLTTPVGKCSAADQKRLSPDTIRRPELAMLEAQADLLAAQEELERAPDRPKLGAFATAGYGRPGLNFLNDEFDFYFIGGVQMTVPLTFLYAGTHRNGDKQLSIQRSILARQRDAVMAQVNVQNDTQGSELSRLDVAIELDGELLKMRESARKQTELQLDLGTSTTADLVNDLTSEDQARSRGAVHRAQRSLACHQLALLKGER